jgi:phosphotransferase system HPr (HPr) family protein
MNSLEKNITVGNRKGVHGRIATEIIKIARHHGVRFHILHDDHVYDCSSVLDILGIALTHGETFTLRADGGQSREALSAVEMLMNEADKP